MCQDPQNGTVSLRGPYGESEGGGAKKPVARDVCCVDAEYHRQADASPPPHLCPHPAVG